MNATTQRSYETPEMVMKTLLDPDSPSRALAEDAEAAVYDFLRVHGFNVENKFSWEALGDDDFNGFLVGWRGDGASGGGDLDGTNVDHETGVAAHHHFQRKPRAFEYESGYYDSDFGSFTYRSTDRTLILYWLPDNAVNPSYEAVNLGDDKGFKDIRRASCVLLQRSLAM